MVALERIWAKKEEKVLGGFYLLHFTQICHLFAVDTWNSVELPCARNEVVLASASQPWEDEGWSDQISRVDEGCVLRTHATAVLLNFIFYCYKLIFLYIFKSKLILFVSFNCIYIFLIFLEEGKYIKFPIALLNFLAMAPAKVIEGLNCSFRNG